MPSAELEYKRNMLTAALHGLSAGKELADHVLVPDSYGRRVQVFTALNNATLHLDEPFDPDDLDIVDRACERVGVKRVDDRKDRVAKAILTKLISRPKRH